MRPYRHVLYIMYELEGLTIRFLVAGTSTWTTELLGLTATRVGDQERTIVVNQDIAKLLLGSFVNEFLAVGNNGLGDSLTDGYRKKRAKYIGDINALP